MTRIRLAETESEMVRCFAVVKELRPHLSEDQFLEAVNRQQAEGYRLVYLEKDGDVRTVAGFRVMEGLAWGRILYVDDLVSTEPERSQGNGRLLFDWLCTHARSRGCEQLHLDSGVQRFAAHRFYMKRRMRILGYHFQLSLSESAE